MRENVTTGNRILKMILPRYLGALVFVGLLIFLPAGTLKFWNGWLFMGALFLPMLGVMIYLIRSDPELAVKRMRTREKEKVLKRDMEGYEEYMEKTRYRLIPYIW